jgi:hypothetical protein
VRDRAVESVNGLAGKRSTARVGDRDRDHDWQLGTELFKHLVDGDECGLCVQRVEDGLDEQDVDLSLDERTRLLFVGIAEFVEAEGAKGGVVDVGRE